MNRLPRKASVDKIIQRAKVSWGLGDWEITWEYADLSHEGESDPRYWTEKRAHIILDKETARNADKKKLMRLVAHELGHAVVYPIWRCMSDFVETYLKSGKEREVYENAVNSAENIVIDWMIVNVLGL